MTESHLDAVVLGKNHGDKGHSHNNPEYKKHVVGTVRVGIAISIHCILVYQHIVVYQHILVYQLA